MTSTQPVSVSGTGGDSGMVRVVYLKYDGSPHRSYPARWLGRDGGGSWLGVPAGTVADLGGKPTVRQEPYALYVPDGRWWTAMFNAAPRPSEIYCDVTTPATWIGSTELTVIDLDLDVRRRRQTGRVELLDEDEFAEHQARYGYPREAVVEAERAARWLVRALRGDTEPFAGGYYPWLAQVAPEYAGLTPPQRPPSGRSR